MAEEPEKKIEEALRAYARKRREDAGPPLEMHPATRRMLQGEVAKLKAAQPQERRPWWQSPFLIWPRVAAAVGMLAVLATGIWVFTQSENQKLSQTVQEGSYRRLAERSESGDAAQTKRGAELKAEADNLSATEELGRQAAAKKPAEIMLNESRLRDTETVPEALPPSPVVISEVRREKQITVKYDAPAQQPTASTESPLLQTAGDKSDVALFKEPDAGGKRRFRVQDGRFVQPFGADSNGAITSGVTLSAANQPVDAFYFAFADTNVGSFANLGYLTQPRLNLPDTNQLPGLDVATFTAGLVPAAGGPTVLATEWAAAARGNVAKNELALSRAIQPTETSRRSPLPLEVQGEGLVLPVALQKFQLEQYANGRITIRDADGSVYEGQTLAAKTVTDLDDVKAKDEVRESNRKLAAHAAVPSVSFRASGTNRNKDLVVINGELLREDDQLARAPVSAGKAAATPTPPAEPATGAPLATSEFEVARRELQRPGAVANVRAPDRISGDSTSSPVFTPTAIRGRVQIGRTNQLELRAVRTR